MAKGELLTVPNLITLTRLVCFPVLWGLAFLKLPQALAVGILLCLLTDFLDGFLARRLGQATKVGAVLDSLADNLLLVSAPIWVFWLRPEIVRENPIWVGLYGGLLAAVFLVMFLKFRRNVEIHTYAAKIGVVVTWIFLIHSLLFPYSRVFFYVAMTASYYYLIEDLALLLTRKELDEHVVSIFPVGQR